MKTKLFLTGLLFFIYFNVNAQKDCNSQGDVCALCGPKFIQGLTGVVNEFYVYESNAPANTQDVYFWITNPTYSTIYGQGWGTYNSGYQLWYYDVDMGTLPNDAVLYGEYLDASSATLGYTNDYFPQIISTPAWLSSTYQGKCIVYPKIRTGS